MKTGDETLTPQGQQPEETDTVKRAIRILNGVCYGDKVNAQLNAAISIVLRQLENYGSGECHLCNLPFTNLIEHYKAAHPQRTKQDVTPNPKV